MEGTVWNGDVYGSCAIGLSEICLNSCQSLLTMFHSSRSDTRSIENKLSEDTTVQAL